MGAVILFLQVRKEAQIYFATVLHNSHLLPQKSLNKNFMWKYLLFEAIIMYKTSCFFFFLSCFCVNRDSMMLFLFSSVCDIFVSVERVIEV